MTHHHELNRRTFMKILGASLAAGAALPQTGCALPDQTAQRAVELEPGATYDYTVEIPLWEGIDIDSVVINYIVKGTKP